MPKRYNVNDEDWKQSEDFYIRQGEARPDDIVILVLGSAGGGKSTFINHVLRTLGSTTQAAVSDGLNACTSQVSHYFAEMASINRRLVLVDTPGFDHTNLSNAEVLRQVAVWVASSYVYGVGMRIAGVIYIHSIIPDRFSEGDLSGFNVFQRICGQEALPCIFLATTKWDMCENRQGERRERELVSEWWKEILSGAPQNGSPARLDNTEDSAFKLVDTVVENLEQANPGGVVLLLQRQIVEQGKALKKTDAGRITRPRSVLSRILIALFGRFFL